MANIGGGLQGILGGSGSGALLGSSLGPIGTGIGAGIGGLAGLLGGLFGGGKKGGIRQLPFNPQQQDALQLLLSQGQELVSDPLRGFEPLAQRARSQFAQQTVPGLAERFTSMGAGSLSSPAFISQLGQAGAGLEEGLAALGAQFGQQNRRTGLEFLMQGLRPAYESYYQQSQPGFGENILSGSIRSAPAFLQAFQLRKVLDQLQANPRG